MNPLNKIKPGVRWLFNSKLRAGIVIVLLLLLGFAAYKTLGNKTAAPQYQTTQAQKGTLITTVTASGTITAGNSVDISTNATGIVSSVQVKNGDTVSQGDKIAEITLDLSSQQKQAAAWSSYLSSKTALDAAQSKINSLQAAEFKANQAFINDAVARNLVTADPNYVQENASWKQAEADYKNQAAVITQTQAAVNSSWLAYSQISSIITAPMIGTIGGLSLTPGLPLTSNSTSSSSSNSSSSSTTQKLGSVTMEQGGLQASVNLSEIDVTKVSPGQKVTLTLDAFPDKTFTGRVLTIDTNGTVSSGVTTYPVTIGLATALNNIYPNMAVNATIITNVKDNVLVVPSGAIQTSGGQSTIRVLKNDQIQTVDVVTGDSSDTQTEISSGLNEGETVVTGTVKTGAGTSGGTTGNSPFSGGFGRGFGGGGGGIRVGGGHGG